MAQSIFDIKPNVITRDLKGRTILIYGEPKAGKSTIASRFPKALFLATEKGTGLLPGVQALFCEKWGDIKKAYRELKTDKAKEMYDTIVIDTVDLAYDLCTKSICSREGVEQIGKIPYGAGYNMVAEEFDNILRGLINQGYGVVLISHAQDKTFTDEDGVEFQKKASTLPNKAMNLVNRAVDMITYAHAVENPETGETEVKLTLRGTPRVTAGSRFPKGSIPNEIPFNYDALVDTVAKGVEAIENLYGAGSVSDERVDIKEKETVVPIEDLIASFQELANKAMKKDKTFFGPRIQKIVADNLGTGRKIAEATVGQEENVQSALDELKDLIEEYKNK